MYDFKEFQGTKEQCIQWLGGFNLEQVAEKIMQLPEYDRKDFRHLLIRRSKDYLNLKE